MMVKKKPGLLSRLTQRLPTKAKADTPAVSQESDEASARAVKVLAVVLFLLPLLFLPLTAEYYQTAKLALSGAAVIFLAVFAILPSVKERTLVFPPSLLFPAVLSLLLAVAGGAFFSIDSTGSLLGQFSSPHGSLLSYAVYFLLFIFVGVYLRTEAQMQKLFQAWAAGSTILALLTILQYFNLFVLPLEYAQQRFWGPTGSPTFTSVYLAASVFICVYLIQESKVGSSPRFWFLAALVQVLALGLVGHAAAWIALLIGGLILIVLLGKDILAPDYRRLRYLGALTIIGGALGSDGLRHLILPGDLVRLPAEIILDWGASWGVVAQILSQRPLFGAGPETFGLIYPQIKNMVPISIANVQVNFPRAGVEALQLVAGTGLLGLAAIGFVATAFWLTIKQREHPLVATPYLAAATSTLLVSWLFLPAGVVTAALLFVALGLLASASRGGEQVVVVWPDVLVRSGDKVKDKRPLSSSVVVSLQLFGFGVVALVLGRYLLADFYYRRAIGAFQTGNGQAALVSVNRAISFSPSRDEYSVGAATINLALASNLSRQPEATESGSTTAQLMNSFANAAVNQARRATALGPQRVGNWQNLGEVYRNLLTYLPGAGPSAVTAYQQAIQLDPANLLLSINLGNIFLALNETQGAIAAFNNAIRIRADQPAAYLGLARAYRLNKESAKAVPVYEQLLTFDFDKESDVYKVIQKEYEEAKTAAETEGKTESAPASAAPAGVAPVELQPPAPAMPGSQPLVPSEVEPVVQPTTGQP